LPRSFVVGTAGHIDHGKSALVRALTGTDPDRLKEEKERGITTDLGFAHASLSADVVASFIDVPGHEKFVRNMLAGIGGIDAVLLVVSATEGVMPQTREHFDICRLLGIERGLVAITKTDIADGVMIDRAERSVRDLVGGSFLAGAPMIRTSLKNEEGLDALRARLSTLAQHTAPRDDAGVLRLPVDRVFALRGFGTVVTGTLTGGAVTVGEELTILPEGRTARVRGLQVHGGAVTRARSGERTAVNLAGVGVEDLGRGSVLGRAGTLRPADAALIELEPLKGCAIRNGARVHVHSASSEALARVRLPSDASARRTLAEIRLESPLVLSRGVRLILRSYSPVRTIAGGRVLDPATGTRRRSDLMALDAPSLLSETDPGAVARWIRESGHQGIATAEIAVRLAVDPRMAGDRASKAPAAARVSDSPERWIDESVLGRLETAMVERLRELHAADPIAPGISREHARGGALSRVPLEVCAAVLDRLSRAGDVVVSADLVRLSSHRVSLSTPEENARDRVAAALRDAALQGLELRELHLRLGLDRLICEKAVRILVQAKEAERIGDGLLVGARALDDFQAATRARFGSGGKVDVGEVKRITGLTRKHVIPLLEWLDRIRVTRRSGAERIVL
jgi:selenocysteine-specific elongation factor